MTSTMTLNDISIYIMVGTVIWKKKNDMVITVLFDNKMTCF